MAVGSLGSAYYRLGQYQKAIEHYEKAVDIKRAIGDQNSLGIFLGNIGSTHSTASTTPPRPCRSSSSRWPPSTAFGRV